MTKNCKTYSEPAVAAASDACKRSPLSRAIPTHRRVSVAISLWVLVVLAVASAAASFSFLTSRESALLRAFEPSYFCLSLVSSSLMAVLSSSCVCCRRRRY